ncbi:MAG TPA: hypothetical protein VGI03_09890 [Verrucomicrobiae bacterium]
MDSPKDKATFDDNFLRFAVVDQRNPVAKPASRQDTANAACFDSARIASIVSKVSAEILLEHKTDANGPA